MVPWSSRRHRAVCAVVIAMILMRTPLAADERETTVHQVVENGRAASTIVIAAQPAPAAYLAAIEIQYAVERITGVEIPIARDNETVDGRRIVIGENKITRALGLSGSDFSHVEYLVEVTPRQIVLLGRDEESSVGKTIDFNARMERSGALSVQLPGMYQAQGSLRAAYHLLEHCGVRYYGPREYQCHFPTGKTLEVESFRVRREPAIKYTNGLTADRGRRLGWPIQKILYDDPTSDEVLLFARRMRTGGKPWYVNHTYHHMMYKARFGKQPDPRHPQVYQGFKKEFWPPEGSRSTQFCYTSEALAQQVARDAADYFDGKLADTPYRLPVQGMDLFPVVPNDAGNYCTCDRCQAWLSPSKDRRLPGVFGDGTATDYVFNFANMVARHLAKTHPDKRIAVLAYEGYLWAPLACALEPNVVAVPCMVTCSYWNRAQRDSDWKAYRFWQEKSARDDSPFYLWNYFHHPEEIGVIRKHKVFPQFSPTWIHQWARRYREDGVDGVFLCGWGEGLDFYTLMKSYDDPGFDLNAFLDEYFVKSFGPVSGSHLRKFHDLIETISTAPENYGGSLSERVFWEIQGSSEHLAQLETHLLAAEKALPDMLSERRFAPWKNLMTYMKEGHYEWKAKKETLLRKAPHTRIADGYIHPAAVYASGGNRHYRLVTGHHMIEETPGVFGTRKARLNVTNDGDRGFEFYGGPDGINVTFDMGDVYELDEIRIWNFQQNRGCRLNRKGMKYVKIEVSHESDELSSWRHFTAARIPIANDKEAFEASLVLPARSTKARYVRITAVGGPGEGNWAEPDYHSATWAGLGQVRFYGKRSHPPDSSLR